MHVLCECISHVCVASESTTRWVQGSPFGKLANYSWDYLCDWWDALLLWERGYACIESINLWVSNPQIQRLDHEILATKHDVGLLSVCRHRKGRVFVCTCCLSFVITSFTTPCEGGEHFHAKPQKSISPREHIDRTCLFWAHGLGPFLSCLCCAVFLLIQRRWDNRTHVLVAPQSFTLARVALILSTTGVW